MNRKVFITERNEWVHIVDKLGRSTYKITFDDNNSETRYYVLKLEPEINSMKQLIWRKLFQGSLPFQNEFRVLREIEKRNSTLLNFPKIENLRVGKYIISECLNATELNIDNLDNNLSNLIGEVLYNISNVNRPKKWSFLKESAFRLLESPTLNLFKYMIRTKRKYDLNFKDLLYLYLKVLYLIKDCNIDGQLIHNDIGPNNILLDKENNIYLIDWEDAIWEKKWPLLDIAFLSISTKNGKINDKIFNSYVCGSEKRKRLEEEEIKKQFQAGYVYKLFKNINLKRTSIEEKQFAHSQIIKIINNENYLEDWWNKNCIKLKFQFV